MKTSIKYMLVVAICFFCSCKKFLETPQPSQINLSSFWKTSKDAELGLAAVYNAAQLTFEYDFWRWGELRGDNFINNDRPSADNLQLVSNQLTSTTVGADWSAMYTAISTANTAIKRIPNIPDFALKNDYLAQALTVRALLYFYAVRVWGDVPKIVDPIEGLDQELNFEKSPASSIFKDIILPDLEKAEKLVTTTRSLNNFSLGGILALKAHVFMWPGAHQNFTTARAAITQIETLGYTLETTRAGWVDIFRGNQKSNEIVFALAWTFNEDGGNRGVGQFTSATPMVVPSDALEQKWRSIIPDDYRILETAAFDVKIIPNVEFPYLRVLTKYSPRFVTRDLQGSWASTNDKDIIFFRLSELLLLKAEAENNLNNPAQALALINKIRTARGLKLVDVTITDKTTVRNMILDDRQFELMGEGSRYWDLVRNNVVLDVMKPINGMSDARRIY